MKIYQIPAFGYFRVRVIRKQYSSQYAKKKTGIELSLSLSVYCLGIIDTSLYQILNWEQLPVRKNDRIFSTDFIARKTEVLKKSRPTIMVGSPGNALYPDHALHFITGNGTEFLVITYSCIEDWLEYEVYLVSVFKKEHDKWSLWWENTIEHLALPEQPLSPSPVTKFDINGNNTLELWEAKYTAIAFGNIIPLSDD